MRSTIASASRPGHRRQHRAEVAVVVQQARRRELEQLKRPQGGLAQRRVELARRDDRPAGARRPGHPRLALEAEGHPEALREALLGVEQPVGRVAAPLVGLGGLAQPDQHEPPLDLIAEPPPQPGVGRAERVGPRTCGVGEVRGGDCGHNHEDRDARHGERRLALAAAHDAAAEPADERQQPERQRHRERPHDHAGDRHEDVARVADRVVERAAAGCRPRHRRPRAAGSRSRPRSRCAGAGCGAGRGGR